MLTLPTQSSDYVRSESGVWVPDLFGKQWDIYNSRKVGLLVSGSRLSGKSHGVLHRIVRHLWETKGARVAFFAKSVKLAKDGGLWQELLEKIMPEWLENLDGFDITTIDSTGNPGPKQDAQTRTAYFRIRNYYGGESEIKLFSIDNDNEIEAKVKSKNFSLIFFSELSMFRDSMLLPITIPSLRMGHLRPWKHWHQWIADTNPDIELGCRSWFYQIFYEKRFGGKLDEILKTMPDVREALNEIHVIEMFMEDNPHLDPMQVAMLKLTCADKPSLWDSYVLGIHGDGGLKLGKLFAPFFNLGKHVIGGGDDQGDQCDVHETTTTLYGGWDVGTTNHGCILLEKWYRLINGEPKVCYSVLDELVFIGEVVGLAEFTSQVMEKIAFIEKNAKRTFEWVHWSDNSSMNVFRPSSNSYDYMEIRAASQGKIELLGASKPKGSIDARVRILKLLLREERIFVSSRCVHTIAMIEKARRGPPETFKHEGEEFELPSKEPILRDQHKHVFDALTYPIYMESIDELLHTSMDKPTAMNRDGAPEEEGMISVSLD